MIKPGRLQKDWWAGNICELGSYGGDFTISFIKIYKYIQYANDFNQVTNETIELFLYYNTDPNPSSKMKCLYIPIFCSIMFSGRSSIKSQVSVKEK